MLRTLFLTIFSAVADGKTSTNNFELLFEDVFQGRDSNFANFGALRKESNYQPLQNYSIGSIADIQKMQKNIDATLKNTKTNTDKISQIDKMKLPTPEFKSPTFNSKYVLREQIHELWTPYLVESERQTRANLDAAWQEWLLMNEIIDQSFDDELGFGGVLTYLEQMTYILYEFESSKLQLI